MPIYLVVEKKALEQNIAVVKNMAGNRLIYGVIKGNGYGLGLVEMARTLRENGISAFAVTEPEDVAVLRNAGFVDEEILVLRSTAITSEIEILIDYNATATLGSYDAAVAANGIAEARGTILNAHIKIDTGMGRYGFNASETDKVLALFRYMPNLALSGIYTHLGRAWAGEKYVCSQADALMKVAEVVKNNGFDPGILHIANSSALMKDYPCTRLDAVRVGSALTGRIAARGNFGLTPVGYAECPVTEIRWLERGQTVGYGAAYKARRPVKIAVIPIGYSNGFCLEKSRDTFRFTDCVRYFLSMMKSWLTRKKITVEINGKRARVLGHVGMLHTVADISDIECQVGDNAVLEVNPLIAGAVLRKKYV